MASMVLVDATLGSLTSSVNAPLALLDNKGVKYTRAHAVFLFLDFCDGAQVVTIHKYP